MQSHNTFYENLLQNICDLPPYTRKDDLVTLDFQLYMGCPSVSVTYTDTLMEIHLLKNIIPHCREQNRSMIVATNRYFHTCIVLKCASFDLIQLRLHSFPLPRGYVSSKLLLPWREFCLMHTGWNRLSPHWDPTHTQWPYVKLLQTFQISRKNQMIGIQGCMHETSPSMTTIVHFNQ